MPGGTRRLLDFLAARGDAPGTSLLERGVVHATTTLGFDADLLVGECVDGVLGDHYPLPVRMLPHAEASVLERFPRLRASASLKQQRDQRRADALAEAFRRHVPRPS